MSDIAIQVENLSKMYHIGVLQQRHDTLRDALVAGLRAPLKRLSSFVRVHKNITSRYCFTGLNMTTKQED